jgi:hypothetical protein
VDVVYGRHNDRWLVLSSGRHRAARAFFCALSACPGQDGVLLPVTALLLQQQSYSAGRRGTEVRSLADRSNYLG